MYFRIINNNGFERFVNGKSNAEGDIIAERLQHCVNIGKIKRFTRIDFEKITPDQVHQPLDVEEGA